MGYASKDRRATTWFRMDVQFSVHQTEPLAHADQAQALAIHRVVPVETDA